MQKFLLLVYRLVCKTGFLRTSLGQKLFYRFYFFYKQHYEAKNADYLQRFVVSGSSVIDVGANAGFFTKKFAKWVSKDSKVFAVEPDRDNIKQLKSYLHTLMDRVVLVEGAAGNTNDVVRFELDPYHPAGHKIVPPEKENSNDKKTEKQIIEVNSYTIDEMLNLHNNLYSVISLIKIDVQGAEKMVLEGAARTIEKYAPALFIEIDTKELNEFGTNENELFDLLYSMNYIPFYIDKKNKLQEINIKVLEKILEKEKYTDLLFLQKKK